MSSAVVDSLQTPPATVEEGACYRILPGATGEWAGHDDEIAARISGGWHFFSPFEGLRIQDVAARKQLYYASAWQAADAPEDPSGGTTVDVEARQALSQLIETLKLAGIMG